MRLDDHNYQEMTVVVPRKSEHDWGTREHRVVKAWTFVSGDIDIEVTDEYNAHLASVTITAEGDVNITHTAYKESM